MKIYFKLFTILLLNYWLSACSSGAEALLKKAKELMQNGQFDEAIDWLNRSIDKNDTNAEAFNTRGVAYFELQDLTNAQLDFETAQKLKPEWYKPSFNMALVAEQKSDLAKAKEYYDIAAQKDSLQHEVYLNRGAVHLSLLDSTAALADFKKTIQLAPESKNGQYNFANISYRLNQFTNAENAFKAAIKLDPKFGKAHYGLGFTYIAINKNDDACLQFKQAKALSYSDADLAIQQFCKNE